MRTSLLLLVLTATTHAGQLAELWPFPPDASPLRPAVEFQRVFGEILAGAPPDKWLGQLESLVQPAPNDCVAQGVAEVARIWLARARMLEVEAALKRYYRRQVRFPEKLASVLNELPAQLQTDPWGQPWVYTVHAPEGFPRQAGQRYQLGPTRCPLLTNLRDAVRDRKPQTVPWQITVQTVGGERSLMFKAKKTSALIQPGGTVDGYALLFLGDKWALMAAQDQLFTVPF